MSGHKLIVNHNKLPQHNLITFSVYSLANHLMSQADYTNSSAQQIFHENLATELSKPIEACFQRLFAILSVSPRGTQAGDPRIQILPAASDAEAHPESPNSVAQNLQRELVATSDQLRAAQRWITAIEASCKTQMLAATQRAQAAEKQMQQSAAVAQAASERTRELNTALQIAEERAERCEAEMQSLRTMLLEAERQINAGKIIHLVPPQSEYRGRTYHNKGPSVMSYIASFRRLSGWR